MTEQNILLLGGRNEERFVSIASAANVLKHASFHEIWFERKDGCIFRVPEANLAAHPLDFKSELPTDTLTCIAPSIASALESALKTWHGRPVFFLALHGAFAEDGTIQKIFEQHGVAFTGSCARVSENVFDKLKTKALVRGLDVKLAKELPYEQWVQADFGTGKVVLKPVRNGSSVGVLLFDSIYQIDANQLNPNEAYFVEEFITGVEVSCGVIETGQRRQAIALEPVEIVPGEVFFDYNSKYTSGVTKEICPARLPGHILEKVKAASVAIHQRLECRGYSRSDFIVKDDALYFLETNTLPGLSSRSLITLELSVSGIAFADFVREQLNIARW